ncbi:MAG TPA: glycoside hydrolase family 28 protein [Pyrinomonadaceae bacterium]|nr:glycoside hydrolase family 28 protein [Pyrinomonadaceae bacterium]
MRTSTRLKIVAAAVVFACLAAPALFGESSAQRRASAPSAAAPGSYNVRSFGARGDGKTVDTPAVNRAIEAAAGAGGGTVYFPAGTYLCFSIRLKSNVGLYLDHGATILAADPAKVKGAYDTPEPNQWDMYQDFGHSHWQNSLIWGIGVENVSVAGPGRIDGEGLTRRSPRPRRPQSAGDTPVSMGGGGARPESPLGEDDPHDVMNGLGNKAISLKLSRNVTLKDFTIYRGGHFAILATGVDNLTIDNLKVDTNRDGFDIDACRNVRISNCSVNTPNDDAIVLKSSYGLGFARATENVTITNCQVTGYDLGTFLDGTFKRTQQLAPDKDGVTGRIKFGTESNGGFKNITISNCVFDRSRGLAIETVDGGPIEDIVVTNITMRDVTTAPIFLRLGRRQRGPAGSPVSVLRRVEISNVVAYDADPRFASIIAGLPGHPIEDVRLTNIRILYKGGGTREQAALEPPEKETNYPEPSMFGDLPAYGFFIRHARGVELSNVTVGFMREDLRPAFHLEDVRGAVFHAVTAQKIEGVPTFVLKNVEDFTVRQSRPVSDTRVERTELKRF